MGARGKAESPSERKRESNRANARRPRGKWAGTRERAQLEEARAKLRECLPDAAGRVAKMIRDPATPPELFLQATKLAADRGGLPVLTQQELVGAMSIQPIQLIVGGHPRPDGGALRSADPDDGAAALEPA